jgi:hypothetical protein
MAGVMAATLLMACGNRKPQAQAKVDLPHPAYAAVRLPDPEPTKLSAAQSTMFNAFKQQLRAIGQLEVDMGQVVDTTPAVDTEPAKAVLTFVYGDCSDHPASLGYYLRAAVPVVWVVSNDPKCGPVEARQTVRIALPKGAALPLGQGVLVEYGSAEPTLARLNS